MILDTDAQRLRSWGVESPSGYQVELWPRPGKGALKLSDRYKKTGGGATGASPHARPS